MNSMLKEEQHLRPLALELSSSSVRKGSGSGSSPAEQFRGSVWCSLVLPRRANRGAAGRPPPPALRSGGGTPASRKPGSAGSRPSSPRPPAETRLACLGSTCRPRATLPGAAGSPGRRRPGKPRHDPCSEVGHGSRLGFPGRRPPRGPATPGKVPRGLQVLPRQASGVSSGGRGELGLDPAEPGLRLRKHSESAAQVGGISR